VGAAQTFSDAAPRRAETLTTATLWARARKAGAALPACKRTNHLVKAILEIVELRGLEPLTFSLMIRNLVSWSA
jgi:hypothetical protein